MTGSSEPIEQPAEPTVDANLSPEEELQAWNENNPTEDTPSEEPEEQEEPEGEEPDGDEQEDTPPVEPDDKPEEPEEEPEEPKETESSKLDALKEQTESFLKGIDDEWSRTQLGKVLELAAEVGAEQAVARVRAEQEAKEAAVKAQEEEQNKAKQEHDQQQLDEMTRAEKEKRIPPIKSKDPVGSEAWLQDEGVKARQNVLKFQADFNAKLEQKGAKWRVDSFEQALELYEKEQLQKQTVEQEQQEGQIQRQAGAKVLRSSGTGESSGKQSFYTPGASLEEVHSRVLDSLQSN